MKIDHNSSIENNFKDDQGELYADLCNWFWYHSHPDYPRDSFRHTSSECRRWALEVFQLLGIL